jgi:hypothetical protein
MKAKLLFLALSLSLPVLIWSTVSRAQQAPTTIQANPNNSANSTAANTAAMASISGAIADAKSGQPLRRASVSLRQANAGGGRGGNGGRGGQGGQGPGANNALVQGLQPGTLPGDPSGAGSTQGQGGAGFGGGFGGQQGQGPGGGRNQVTTGDDGTYSFLNVNPGQYQVVVDRDGFITQEYGQRSWVSGTGVTLTVTAGQKLANINVAMVPAGTIAGTIRDETGEAMAGIQVQALSYQYQNGSKTLVSAKQVPTDDRGEYRLFWLPPGDYYVSAIPNGPGGRRGQAGQNLAAIVQQLGLTQAAGAINAAVAAPTADEAYAPSYYPGGIDPENAVAITLPPAQELDRMDFVLRPIQMLTVSGKVTPFDVSSIPLTPAQQQAQQRQQAAQAQQGNRGGRGGNNNGGNFGGGGRGNPNNLAGVNVILTRIGPIANNGGGGRGGRGGGGGGGGRGGFGGPGQPRAIVGQDGTFQVSNVVPGSYNLMAIQQAAGMVFSARTKVEVGFSNVSNINLAVVPGIDIKGQIATEDGKSPTNFRLNNVRIQLTPTEEVPVGNTQAQVQADGTFTLTGVPAMSYKVNVTGINAGYVISGQYGNNEVLNQPLQVDAGQTGSILSFLLGFQPGTVTGDVRDSKDQPFQAATCVLVPNARNRLDLYKTAASDQNGKITFTSVAPGEYKLFSWESVPTGAYQDADYLHPFEDKGKVLTIGKGGSQQAQITVIPAMTQ